MSLLNTLSQKIDPFKIEENVDLKKLSTFRVAGTGKVLVNVSSVEDIINAVTVARNENVPYAVIGKGSDLLFYDEGYDGILIKVGKDFSSYEVDGDYITCDAGMFIGRLAKIAKDFSLTGLEAISGIPGNVGGSIYMNAAAYNAEISDNLVEVEVLDEYLQFRRLDATKLYWGYRETEIAQENMIVLRAKFKLQKGNQNEIIEKMKDFKNKRFTKQPMQFPSVGATFRRPKGYYIGTLIRECGLAGYTVGGAQISEHHTGFVVNAGNATAKDILAVVKHVQNTLYEEKGVHVRKEFKIVGKDIG